MRICVFGNACSVHLQRIVTGLVARGLGVHVVTHKVREIPGATVERFRIPSLGLARPFRWNVRWWRYLRSLVRRFDVAHVHFLQDWGFTPEIIEQGCFMASPWGSDIVTPPGERGPDEALVAARVAMLQHAAAVTAWGPTFASTVAAYAGLDAARIDLLPLGVELELFKPVAAGPRAAPRVGFFKGFRKVYGATYLLRAVPGVLESMPDTRFELIGDGPQLPECRELAGQLGLEGHVRWIARQSRERLPKYLAGWDVSVIPSVCESFGVAALESSAMRVPVVASAVGGLPDAVRHGVTGLLVPPRAPAHLARAIAALLEDRPRRQRMGDAGRALVEREYEWQGILDKWVRTYEAALDRTCATV